MSNRPVLVIPAQYEALNVTDFAFAITVYRDSDERYLTINNPRTVYKGSKGLTVRGIDPADTVFHAESITSWVETDGSVHIA